MNQKSQNSLPERERVLFVDDDSTIRLIAHNMLKETGFDIYTANSGREACEMAGTLNPDLILLDITLPDLSGYDVLRKLRKNEQTRNIPVVLTSANTLSRNCAKALDHGAIDYIEKPFDKHILLSKTKTFVRHSRYTRELLSMHRQLLASHAELTVYQQAINSVSDGLIVCTKEGQITHQNRAFRKQIGTESDEESIGRFITEFFPDPVPVKILIEKAENNLRNSKETLLKCNGPDCPVLVKCSPIHSTDNEAEGLVFLITDQTERLQAESERQRLETELYQAQKLESVGQLAAGIAHEINTPIQFISDNLRFMRNSIPDFFRLAATREELFEEVRKYGTNPELIQKAGDVLEDVDTEYLLEEIPDAIIQSQEGTERVANIVRAMKDFAHPGTIERIPADINKAIETTIIVSRNRWKYDAEMVTNFDETLPLVPCLVGELNQAILNLIINAGDAIASQRKKTQNSQLGKISISTHRKDPMLEIRIQDTGGGIPEQIQGRIFDPFFTTKDVGKGTGQGLAITRNIIVKKHDGTCDFETIPGEGSTFIIQLPLNIL